MTAMKHRHVPSLRHHKASGQGFVELNGRRIYLGRFDVPGTRQRYHRTIAEWIANGKRLPVDAREITITELIAQFWRHVEGYYRKPDGTRTQEALCFRSVLRLLRGLYGECSANEFGPRALKSVRQRMIDEGRCRTYVNKSTGRIKRMFRWALENELIDARVYQGFVAVSGLKRGRTDAREPKPVKPVPDSAVEATLPHTTSMLRAMVQVQALTGMRPGEVCLMRGCDLDMSGKVWAHRPESHKTEHHGLKHLISIGPRAQGRASRRDGPFSVESRGLAR